MPRAERARRSARTDGLGDRFTVQQCTPTPPARASNLEHFILPTTTTARLNELIQGKRGMTADTALRLAKLLKTDAEIWMNLQAQYDLWHAARAQRQAS